MSLGGWESYSKDGVLPHIVPRRDLRTHEISVECWCKPAVENEMIVHNSLDGRERYENGVLRLH